MRNRAILSHALLQMKEWVAHWSSTGKRQDCFRKCFGPTRAVGGEGVGRGAGVDANCAQASTVVGLQFESVKLCATQATKESANRRKASEVGVIWSGSGGTIGGFV